MVDRFSPLDLYVDLTPSAEVVKKAGDTLVVALKVESSGDYKVSWTKVQRSPSSAGGTDTHHLFLHTFGYNLFNFLN